MQLHSSYDSINLTKQRDMALRFVRAYSEEFIVCLPTGKERSRCCQIYKEKDPRILSEIYGIYGIKRLDKILTLLMGEEVLLGSTRRKTQEPDFRQ